MSKHKQKRKKSTDEPQESEARSLMRMGSQETEDLAVTIVRADDPEIRTAAFVLLMDEITVSYDRETLIWHATRAAFGSGDFAEVARARLLSKMRAQQRDHSIASDAVYAVVQKHNQDSLKVEK